MRKMKLVILGVIEFYHTVSTIRYAWIRKSADYSLTTYIIWKGNYVTWA